MSNIDAINDNFFAFLDANDIDKPKKKQAEISDRKPKIKTKKKVAYDFSEVIERQSSKKLEDKMGEFIVSQIAKQTKPVIIVGKNHNWSRPVETLCGKYKFPSMTEAATYFKITKSAIQKAIVNGHNCKGFFWKYVNETPEYQHPKIDETIAKLALENIPVDCDFSQEISICKDFLLITRRSVYTAILLTYFVNNAQKVSDDLYFYQYNGVRGMEFYLFIAKMFHATRRQVQTVIYELIEKKIIKIKDELKPPHWINISFFIDQATIENIILENKSNWSGFTRQDQRIATYIKTHAKS